MTDKPEPKKPPPASKKGKQKKPKVKRVRKVGVLSILFLFFLAVIILTITPLYSITLSYLPQSYQHLLVGGFYQSVTLSEDQKILSEPLKYTPEEPLPVFGNNSGVCFSFGSTTENENKEFIDIKRLKNAEDGQKIAEIIVIGNNKYEYSLSTTTMNEKFGVNTNSIATVCQTFGRDYPVVPLRINAVYVRPLKPFTPQRVFWATTHDIPLE